LLGNLFKSRSSDVSKTNLMVFIHPVILRDGNVTSDYTNSKYSYMRALQRGEDAKGVSLQPGRAQPVLPDIKELGRNPALDSDVTAPTDKADKGSNAFDE
jgi:general secretion pathway protein D